MTAPETFSCYLVGGQSLLIRCAELLQQKGHRIVGIASSDPAVRHWAHAHTIPLGDRAVELRGAPAFDYLFSIANFTVLPADVLALPRRGAINFHDGPLPEYAGLNVPTWALLNGETAHGISWHLMTGDVDRGAVLKSRAFPIEAQETAFTLNAKCYDAGIESFGELIEELADGTLEPRQQDRSKYRYHAKCRRPAAACCVDWQAGAEAIDVLVRALDYGPYRNPLGLAKLYAGARVYALGKVEVLEQRSGASAGTVVSAGEFLTVATSGHDLSLLECRDFAGRAVSGTAILAENGLAVGDRFPSLSPSLSQELSDLDRRCCAGESDWIDRLASLEALELPYAEHAPAAMQTAQRSVSDQLTPAPLLGGDTPADTLLGALLVYFSRLGHKPVYDIALAGAAQTLSVQARLFFETAVPFRVDVDNDRPARAFSASLGRRARAQGATACYARDLVLRQAQQREAGRVSPAEDLPIAVVCVDAFDEALIDAGRSLVVAIPNDAKALRWYFNPAVFSESAIARMQAQFGVMLDDMAAYPGRRVAELSLMPAEERRMLLRDWNRTDCDYDQHACLHRLFEARVRQAPDAPAISFQGSTLSYRQLNERANRVAHCLLAQGVEPDTRVGVLMDRCTDMVVALLGVLKAGAAYLPLDPAYPRDRIRYMIDDADIVVLLTQDKYAGFSDKRDIPLVSMDDAAVFAAQPADDPRSAVCSDHLAYTIYTSGSTGRPKGVMVEHRNVVSFFAGMDQRIEHDQAGVWLAVTSISFDISVLEIFWTLTRGFHLVLFAESGRAAGRELRSRHPERHMDFSLFYWNVAGSEADYDSDKYGLLLESAKFGDRNGFKAVWTPERHFQSFGGLYPNPSVTSAALATVTEQIELRAGSCVVPLHSPIRIAEEWAVVDNLSNGRVGIAMAAGWQPNDFVIRPESFARAKDVMFESADIIKRLWRGETVEFTGPKGDTVEVRTLPRPIRPELPVWITTAGNPETYRQAAEIGAHVLTHLLGQSVEELAEKIDLYRRTWRASGHPGEGHVTLLLHTLVGPDEHKVREMARAPMKNYLKSAVFLVKAAAWSFPTFKKLSEESGQTLDEYFDSMSEQDMDELLDFAFERYYETSGLFGTPERCLDRVDRLKQIGVDEIGCLIDFGADSRVVLDHLPYLRDVKNLCIRQVSQDEEDDSIAGLIRRYRVTHLQCTPSLAGMLTSDAQAKQSLAGLRQMMVGGEAFPEPLARELASLVSGRVTNMYGPTETTIWSTTHDVSGADTPVPIGRPIANTRLYVLDSQLQAVPRGVAGELFIGGAGVVRGYHRRPELTAERFLNDPFSDESGARMYRTGDLVRYRDDGVLEYLGRVDNQVKILGYRIELGEIEARLQAHEQVREAVVLLREDTPGDKRLVAYLRYNAGGQVEPALLKAGLQETLPEFMVPSVFVEVDEMPLTPNGKIDRRALPAPAYQRVSSIAYVAPTTETESRLAAIWSQVLELPRVGARDNFFDLGGHSLTAIQVVHLARRIFNIDMSLQSLFRAPVLSELAELVDAAILASADDDDLSRLLDELETMSDEDAARAGRGH